MLASNSTAVRAPEVYAVRPRSWPDGSATGTRHEMMVWPWPDQACSDSATVRSFSGQSSKLASLSTISC